MNASTPEHKLVLPVSPQRFKVEVVYCRADGPVRQTVELTEGDTVEAAVTRARFHQRFRELDLAVNRVGIFGTIVSTKTVVRSGDRVEIYRPITCDPETVPRRDRAATDNNE